jgi:hypothetical protein
MELNDEQKQAVAQWVREGCSLSEVQKRLRSEFDISMTYMDVRFLVLDLDVELKDREVKPMAPPPPSPAIEDADGDHAALPFPGVADDSGDGVSIEVDTIMKPGALVSGTVAFSDGKSGSWMLDQFGRLALDVGDPAYRPSPEDMQAFQVQLQQSLTKRGF